MMYRRNGWPAGSLGVSDLTPIRSAWPYLFGILNGVREHHYPYDSFGATHPHRQPQSRDRTDEKLAAASIVVKTCRFNPARFAKP
jgi:hypothetical protein